MGTFLHLDQNTRIHYEIRGSGQPIILIHGFALDFRMWEYQVPDFSQHFRVVRYDMRGYGHSSIPDALSPYSHADDLIRLISSLSIEKVIVLGLSRGGTVAIDFALKYPDRITALIIASAMPPGFPNPNYVYWSVLAQELGIESTKAKWLNTSLFEGVRKSKELTERVEQMTYLYSGWHWTNEDPGFYHFPHSLEHLINISVPTLSIVGEKDQSRYIEASELISKNIKLCQRLTIAQVSHFVNMENPALFNSSVNSFIDSVINSQ